MSRFLLGGMPLSGENEEVRGIYLHIPFCLRKCSYCDFYSVEAEAAAMREFCDLLARETDLLRNRFPEDAAAPADTVYFGGGTPTVLPPDTLCGLLDVIRERFPVESDAEITVEANPGTASPEQLSVLRKGGVTRISIGVQSFTPSILRTLGRVHGREEVGRTVRDAQAAGFDSIGIDLIFGVPGQRTGQWEADLERTLRFLPSHVSAYALAPEPGTPIHAAILRGQLLMPPDDTVAEMYETARRALSAAGYRQYEISNFARPGHESRHNIKYWKREGTTGFGPSAHSLLFPRERAPHGLRGATPPSLPEYRNGIRQGRLPWTTEQVCRYEDAWKESLIFGLRMTDGVALGALEERIGPPPKDLRDTLSALVADGRLLEENGRLRLPGELLFVSNEVLQRLA